MRARPIHRLVGGGLDALVLLGIGATAGLLTQGAPPAPLLLAAVRLLAAAYLLLRDAAGLSLGKRRMKLRVISATTGGGATIGQHVLRNVTIAAVPISGDIPVAIQVAWLLLLAEVALVLLGRDRLGDLLAQTAVVSGPDGGRVASAADREPALEDEPASD